MSSPYDPYDWARLTQAADAAPSILNTRPWLFDNKLDSNRIELRPNWARHLTVIDPRHRELFISCGAALFNLRMAIRVTGHVPVVWLIPDKPAGGAVACRHCGDLCGVGDLLASVEIATRMIHPVTLTEQRLYEAIPLRHTVREPFAYGAPMILLTELLRAARAEQADARLLHRRETRRLLRWAARIDQALKLDPLYLEELRTWTGSSAPPDLGVPVDKFGPTPKSRRRPPVRDLGLGWDIARQVKKFKGRSQLIVLETTTDKPSDWLRVGQAMQRLLLTATYYGLETSFLTQELEAEDRKTPNYQSTQQWWPSRESAQMVIRIGVR
ncbi:MAG TPA: hypothetical protein VEH31_18825 [Streptosporangiaceae bacterium]|nr:hypothetical protein [Streptosporangiaceae bacterium]